MGHLSGSSKIAWQGGAIGLGVAFVFLASPAAAEEPGPPQEIWGGADVTANSWSVHSGLTIALFSSLYDNGFRLRAVGGYGFYAYPKHDVTIRGYVGFGDVLLGYQHQFGSLTLKGFMGVSTESHTLAPLDPDSSVVGADLGAKAALEAWWEIGPRTWTSFDVTWSTVHGGTYAARARVGYRLKPQLSSGVEVAADGDAEYDGGRGGAFLRYTWAAGEISASMGASADRSGETGGYGAMNALFRY